MTTSSRLREQILRYAQQRPDATHTEIAARVGCSPTTVSRHLRAHGYRRAGSARPGTSGRPDGGARLRDTQKRHYPVGDDGTAMAVAQRLVADGALTTEQIAAATGALTTTVQGMPRSLDDYAARQQRLYGPAASDSRPPASREETLAALRVASRDRRLSWRQRRAIRKMIRTQRRAWRNN